VAICHRWIRGDDFTRKRAALEEQLRRICVEVSSRAKKQLLLIQSETTENPADWYLWAKDNVCYLWQEELEVAERVVDSVDRKEVF